MTKTELSTAEFFLFQKNVLQIDINLVNTSKLFYVYCNGMKYNLEYFNIQCKDSSTLCCAYNELK